MSGEELDIRRKRLLFRGQHRGFREADLLVGGFVARHVATMDAAALDQLEAVLAENDHDIYDWYLGRRPLPPSLDCDVMRRLMSFRLN